MEISILGFLGGIPEDVKKAKNQNVTFFIHIVNIYLYMIIHLYMFIFE
jgi:hypothetical protein